SVVLSPANYNELTELTAQAELLKESRPTSSQNRQLIDLLTKRSSELAAFLRTDTTGSAVPKVRKMQRDTIDSLMLLSDSVLNSTVEDTAEQARARVIILFLTIAGTVLNLAALAWLGIFLGRDVIARLEILNENTQRLSRGLRLLPQLS